METAVSWSDDGCEEAEQKRRVLVAVKKNGRLDTV